MFTNDWEPDLLSTWVEAVVKVTKHAGINQVRIGREVGLTRSAVNNFLKGGRRISSEHARKINAAIAKFVSDPGVESYLNTAFSIDCERAGKLDESTLSFYESVLGSHTFEDLKEYFHEDWENELAAALQQLSRKQQLRLSLALNGARLKRLIRNIDGEEPSETILNETVRICSAHRVDIEHLIDRGHEAYLKRVRDSFNLLVRQVLFELAPTDVGARNEAHLRIAREHAHVIRQIYRSFAESFDIGGSSLQFTEDGARFVNRGRKRPRVGPFKLGADGRIVVTIEDEAEEEAI